MRDVELYRTILGLTAPWTVVRVDLDVKGQQVVVKVDAGAGPFPCPECQVEVPGYDRNPRRWRHLDTCQFTTWIEGEIPRVACPTHGVKQIRIPWAAPGSQFTGLFERLAIDLLQECSVQGGANLLRITWDEAWGIKERAVTRGLARRRPEVVAHLGVDEKAIAKRHRYLTVSGLRVKTLHFTLRGGHGDGPGGGIARRPLRYQRRSPEQSDGVLGRRKDARCPPTLSPPKDETSRGLAGPFPSKLAKTASIVYPRAISKVRLQNPSSGNGRR